MTTLAEASKRLRTLWASGGQAYGAWCSIPDSFSAEVLGRTGFDWACVDLQHGLADAGSQVAMMQALSATGTPTFVRVPWNEPAPIMRALDLGGVGVIVPMIETAADAAKAVRACRYAPAGIRSYGPTRAALVSGEPPTDEVNRDVICAVMIETPGAIGALDDIAAMPGVDVLFVGPADLRVALGAPSVSDPEFVRQLSRIAERAREHGVVAGIFCPTVEAAITWRELGYAMLALSSDVRLLRSAAAEALARVRDHTPHKPVELSSESGYV
jgi:4-hydroxy-2-oxoheptanedioate aldolase